MQNKSKTIWWVGGIIIVIAFLLILGHSTTVKAPTKTIINPDTLPGLLKTSAPWSSNTNNLIARLKDIGLYPPAQGNSPMHIHAHLDISVNGKAITVPADIGINQLSGFMSSTHTHRTNGVIHIESPVTRTFTLGQFFDVWGVRFTSQCIGSYCATDGNTIKVYVNGKLYTGNPRLLPFKERQEIFIVYGSNKTASTIIFSKYAFPAGL